MHDDVAAPEVELEQRPVGGAGGARLRRPTAEDVRRCDHGRPAIGRHEAAVEIGLQREERPLRGLDGRRPVTNRLGRAVEPALQRARHCGKVPAVRREDDAGSAAEQLFDVVGEPCQPLRPDRELGHGAALPVVLGLVLAPEFDHPAGRKGGPPLGLGQVERVGAHDRGPGRGALAVGGGRQGGAQLVGVGELLGEEFAAFLDVGLGDDQGVRHRLEERSEPRIVARQPVLDAGRPVNRQIAFSVLDDGVLGRDQLRGRADGHARDRAVRALRQRVEAVDRGDAVLVVTHDAAGQRLARRIDIDHLAPDRHFARLVDALVEPVAGPQQKAAERVQVEDRARPQRQLGGHHGVARRRSLQRSADGGEHDPWPALAAPERREGPHPGAHHLARGRRAVVSGAIPGGESVHRQARRQGREGPGEGLDALLAARDEEHAAFRPVLRPGGEADQPRGDEAGRRLGAHVLAVGLERPTRIHLWLSMLGCAGRRGAGQERSGTQFGSYAKCRRDRPRIRLRGEGGTWPRR